MTQLVTCETYFRLQIFHNACTYIPMPVPIYLCLYRSIRPAPARTLHLVSPLTALHTRTLPGV